MDWPVCKLQVCNLMTLQIWVELDLLVYNWSIWDPKNEKKIVVRLIKNNSVQCNAWGNAMHMGYFSALFALAKWVIIIVFLIVFPIAFEPQLFLKIASIKDNDNNHGNFCFRVCTWIISEQTESLLICTLISEFQFLQT